MLDIERAHQMLRWTSVLLLALGLVTLILAIALPYASPSPFVAEKAEDSASGDTRVEGGALPSREAFAKLCSLPLRRSLFDAAPTLAASSSYITPLSIKLMGTAVEGGRSLAIFTTSKQKTEFKAVGETIEGATVLSIQPGRVVVRYQGQQQTLTSNTRGGTTRP